MSNFLFNPDNQIFINENNFNYSPFYNLNSPSFNQPNDNISRATLWMGDLESWMDENYLKQLWNSYGESVIIKLMRDKRTGLNCGYAFIGFNSTQAAQRVLSTVHGTRMPNSTKLFKLNWASGGGIYDRKEDRPTEYSLFVGDLSNDVDETLLLSLFRSRYPSCHSAKIMTDPVTDLSRGYGFVRFSNPHEQHEALQEMNGFICDNRPLRVSYATPKSNSPPITAATLLSHIRYQQLELQAPALIHQATDPNNTTVFVGGLSSPVSESQLTHYFQPFGEITYVKIPIGKGCGFVQYATRRAAEEAIEKMNGFLIGTSRIRLSWGRSQADKQLSPSTSTSSGLRPIDWFQEPSFQKNERWHFNGLSF